MSKIRSRKAMELPSRKLIFIILMIVVIAIVLVSGITNFVDTVRTGITDVKSVSCNNDFCKNCLEEECSEEELEAFEEEVEEQNENIEEIDDSFCKVQSINDLDSDFVNKVEDIGKNLDIAPEHLFTVMHFETGSTYCSCKKNEAGSSALGLIQFTAPTALSLGTSTTELCRMSEIEQLEYVELYFQKRIQTYGKLKTLEDVYLAVFLPSLIGESEDYVLPERYYELNRGLDSNNDGKIIVAEVTSRINSEYEELYS